MRKLAVALACASLPGLALAEPGYTGSQSCRPCHSEVFEAWQGSLHAWAMKPAAAAGAAARFDGESHAVEAGLSIEAGGDDDERWLTLPGQSVQAERYPVTYFLGHGSLEQYLAPFPGGRLQALSVAYDVRREDWFHLFPGEHRRPEEWGHWTNRGMTSNSECLFCHTTGYRKGYDARADGYETTWAEVGVGCEACHGPGEGHPAKPGAAPDPYAASGAIDATSRLVPISSLDRCAPCHSRRSELQDDYRPGQPFLDAFDPELLDRPTLLPDRQLGVDEAFEWASFRSSRMFASGVRCQDCHEVHTAELRAEGDALCLRCHEPGLASPAHTGHAPAAVPVDSTPGCVACHMPERTYMQRDPRRDHSMSIPDAVLSAELGVPNACTGCHGGRSDEWAAENLAGWSTNEAAVARREQRRAEARAIASGRSGDPAAVPGLFALLEGSGDAVERASAARLLGRHAVVPAVEAGLRARAADPEPLVRAGVMVSLGNLQRPSREALDVLEAATRDPVRLVRVHAAYGLRDWRPVEGQPAPWIESALAEWERATRASLERPASLYNLGNFLTARGRYDEGVAAYRRAIRFEPSAVAPRHNLAMFLASQGRLDEAEAEFQEALRRNPDAASTAFTLGLLYGQLGRWQDAIGAFEQCVEHEPQYPRAYYNLGLAQSKSGEMAEAVKSLEKAAGVAGSRSSAARVLSDVHRQLGDEEQAQRWSGELDALGGRE